MSTRYSIGLALEPGFTSRAYRARQLICGQYASWAAEMNMVYLPIAGFLRCTDSAVSSMEASLEDLASRSKQAAPQFELSHNGVATRPDPPGHVFLDFASPAVAAALNRLHTSVVDLVAETDGVNAADANTVMEFQPHLPLLQYAHLPERVFADAVEFARAVATDLQIPSSTQAWRLLLLRFESDAANDDWSEGSWAADLRWELLASYPL
ncbi:MAG: hypothetical protein BZY87_04060 [SAR202 cluster bacterium Io17-Chloro-G6]|nr:MAG: hypothetical protein BZY87_04060 [SAR202 cluster bacterium Io17-Chloro-G6]